MERAVGNKKIKISTLIMGLLMVLIPIIMGALIFIPTFKEWIMMSKGDLFRGLVVGLSVFPVMIFIAIKGGKLWYKKWWTWVLVGVSAIALIVIVAFSNSSSGGGMPGGLEDPYMGMEKGYY